MNRSPAILAFMLLAAAPLAAQAPARWPVAAKPVTIVGIDNGTPEQEIDHVSGAHRLADGRVVVANGKPLELRIYSPAGKLLSRIGRQGDGPGEFRGRLDFLPAGDSILVFDQGSGRMLLYASDGKLVTQWPPTAGGAVRGQTILFHATLGMLIPARLDRCFRQVVLALPPLPAPAFRRVFADGAGRFWSRPDTGSIVSVYNSGGRLLGTAQLPARFEVYEVDAGYITGKQLDEDDVEQVQVLRVAAPPAAQPLGVCDGHPEPFTSVEGARIASLRTVLRQAMTAGEMAYSNYAHYVSTLDSLPGLKEQLPGEVAFRVLRADNRGWAAMAFDRRSALVCVFGVASGTLPGWPDGAIRCSE